jgi:hypothetical protein
MEFFISGEINYLNIKFSFIITYFVVSTIGYDGQEVLPRRLGEAVKGGTQQFKGPALRVYRVDNGERKNNSRCKFNVGLINHFTSN